MSDREVELEKLVLLEGDLLAQRLVVTWGKVWLEYGELLQGLPAALTSEDDFAKAWARLSGVDVDDIERLAPVLFENGLLYEDGAASDTAMGYVKSRIIAEMPRIKE